MAQRPQAEELIQDCTQGINIYLTDGRAQLKAFSRQHRESVKEHDAQIALLKQRRKKLKQLGEQVSREYEKENRQIGKLERDLKGLKSVEESAPKQLEAIQSHLEEEQLAFEEKRKVASDRAAFVESRTTELQKAISTYSKWLSLEIDSVVKDITRFTFTNLDPADFKRPFTFSVTLTQSGDYEVLTCLPNVEYGPSLLLLNQSKSLLNFFVSMRKLFKDSIAS